MAVGHRVTIDVQVVDRGSTTGQATFHTRDEVLDFLRWALACGEQDMERRWSDHWSEVAGSFRSDYLTVESVTDTRRTA
jgi:hypothetical protein